MSREDDENELDAYLEEDIPIEPDPTDPLGERQRVAPPADEDQAAGVLYRLGRLADDIANVQQIAQERIGQIEGWVNDRVRGTTREMQRAEESLELFTRRWREQNLKARSKTLNLWSGTLSLARSRGKLVMTDEPTFMAWATHRRPDLLRYDPKPAKAKLTDGYLVVRHPGPQSELGGTELLNTWRLMVPVIPDGTPSPGCPGCGVINEDPEIIWPTKQVGEDGEPAVTPIRYNCRECGEEWDAPTELVTIPGAAYGEPVRERFTATPSTTKETSK